jgi:hypothetical protein
MSVAGTSSIPYDHWCMGMEDRRRRRGGERIPTKPTALFWCQNVYREFSQLPLRQLSAQRGTNLI